MLGFKKTLTPVKIAGASLALGIGGQAISNISTDVGTKVIQGGEVAAGYVAPAVNITMGGYLINSLRGLKKIKL